MHNRNTVGTGTTPPCGGGPGGGSNARQQRVSHVVGAVKRGIENDWLSANRKKPSGFFATLTEPVRNVGTLSASQTLDVVPFDDEGEAHGGHPYFVGLPGAVNSLTGDDGLPSGHVGLFAPEVACALSFEWPGLLVATVVVVGQHDDGKPRVRVYVEAGNDLGSFDPKAYRILNSIEDEEACRPAWR